MIYSVQSTNDDYSIMRVKNISIPWNCEYIKYYISSFNTRANILVCTKDDFIEFIDNEDDTCVTITFPDCYSITINDIKKLFANEKKVLLNYDSIKRVFKFTSTSNITLRSISHRAALLLGLFNVKTQVNILPAATYEAPDSPILDYGNKFYLVSLQGKAVYTNLDYTPSIIASIDTFIKDGLPIIVNFEMISKPIKIKVNIDSLKYLEMQLVDFMFQPIIIKSPIFATLKIKPCKDISSV